MSTNLMNYVEKSLDKNGLAEHNLRELAAMYTTGMSFQINIGIPHLFNTHI